MTMVIENQNRQYGGMGFDNVYHGNMQHSNPQFSDPWSATHTSSHPNPSMYATSMGANHLGLNHVKQEDVTRPTAISMPYSSIPVSAPSLVAGNNYHSAAGYGSSQMLGMQHEMPRTTFEQAPTYTTASSMTAFTPANYAPMNYGQTLHQQQQHQDARRISHANDTSVSHSQTPTAASFGDALDASRGMVALSQDLTPRNIYGPRSSRGSADSYGFPSTHSSASSISSAGNYPYYSASVASVDSSVTDYSSTTSESLDGLPSRTLPRPSGLLTGSAPPGPQSMMSQFSSKMPSNTQKKHKCKVCDKRFTRPSSLQTHMYSHTGEKPYACDVEGCGRHFSVVSNLRRHKKVHKGEKETASGEEEE
ncbi:hypothetical protein Plec18167_002087 [Paecilomyces lecythidis]|uniref:C2H2-type domain-containing protein n=1 Tax=Paecilomyces lecythidis TaxID=3004212 RepID=A0ABR3Y9F5_9EURO